MVIKYRLSTEAANDLFITQGQVPRDHTLLVVMDSLTPSQRQRWIDLEMPINGHQASFPNLPHYARKYGQGKDEIVVTRSGDQIGFSKVHDTFESILTDYGGLYQAAMAAAAAEQAEYRSGR